MRYLRPSTRRPALHTKIPFLFTHLFHFPHAAQPRPSTIYRFSSILTALSNGFGKYLQKLLCILQTPTSRNDISKCSPQFSTISRSYLAFIHLFSLFPLFLFSFYSNFNQDFEPMDSQIHPPTRLSPFAFTP